MKNYFLIFLFIFSSSLLKGQNDNILKAKEKISLSLNSDCFISGEKLLYTVFCSNSLPLNTPISKVVYVKGFDQYNKEIFTNKHYLENGYATGYFFIPTDLQTNTYKIISYTKWMLNLHPSNYTEKDFLIINPYQPKLASNFLFDSIISKNEINKNEISHHFKKRENITFNDFIYPLKGNFTVSINKTNRITSNDNEILNSELLSSDSNHSIKYLPEIDGEIISGKIIANTDSVSVENKRVSITDNKNPDFFLMTHTNTEGTFYFILPHSLWSNTITIEINENSGNYSLQIDPEINPKLKIYKRQKTYKLIEGYEEEIKKRAIASQIENAYFEIKKDSILLKENKKTLTQNDLNVFDLNNITRFSSLKEFIIEVLNQVYYTDDNNNFKIHFRNSGINYEVYEDPLTLVDGKIISNPNDLLTIDFKTVDTILVKHKPHYFCNKLYSGLFIIKTKNNTSFTKSYPKNRIEMNYIIPQESFIKYSPDYSTTHHLARVPDHRTQLAWQHLKTLNQPIIFATSDIEGIYEIKIDGYTEDGNSISKKSFFIVE